MTGRRLFGSPLARRGEEALRPASSRRAPQRRRRLALRSLAWFLMATALTALGLWVGGGTAEARPVEALSVCPPTAPAVDDPIGGDTAFLDPGVRTVTDQTRYGQRGYSGLTWSTYDTGCIGDFPAELDTTLGNAELGTAIDSVAAWQGIASLTTTADLNPAAQAAGATANALFAAVFSPFAPVAITLSALVMLVAAGRGETARVLTRAGLSIVALGVAGLALNGAGVSLAGDLRAGFSQAIASVQSGVATQLGADPVAGPRNLVVDQVLWRAWKNGEVGASGSDPLAERLYEAQTLTKTEAAQIDANPQSATQLFDAKQGAFQQAASDAQSTNPVAYQSIQGRGSSRIGAGAQALFIAAPIAWFQILAGLLVLGLLLLFALLPVAAPLVGLGAVVNPGLLERAVKTGGVVVAAGLVSAVTAVAQIALATKLLGAAPASVFSSLILLVATVFTRRKLKTLMSVSGVAREVVGQPARAALAVARYRMLARLVTGGTGAARGGPANGGGPTWADPRRARPEGSLLGDYQRTAIQRSRPGRGKPPPQPPPGGGPPPPPPPPPTQPTGGTGATPTPGTATVPVAGQQGARTNTSPNRVAGNRAVATRRPGAGGGLFTSAAPVSPWPRRRPGSPAARAGWWAPPAAIYWPTARATRRATSNTTPLQRRPDLGGTR